MIAETIAVAQAVAAVAGAISGAAAEGAIANANERSSRNTATWNNAARDAGNANVAAQNQLSRFVQATNNSRRMRAGGASLGTAVTNYERQIDTLTRGGFEDSIRAAEAAGSQAASAATAGVSGSVTDNINSATILRNDRLEGERMKQGAAMAQDYRQHAAAVVQETMEGLDNRILVDNFDNNHDVALKYAAPTWFGKFLGAGGLNTAIGAVKSFGSTSGGPKKVDSGWGTGDAYGNQDIGNFL